MALDRERVTPQEKVTKWLHTAQHTAARSHMKHSCVFWFEAKTVPIPVNLNIGNAQVFPGDPCQPSPCLPWGRPAMLLTKLRAFRKCVRACVLVLKTILRTDRHMLCTHTCLHILYSCTAAALTRGPHVPGTWHPKGYLSVNLPLQFMLQSLTLQP